MERQGHRPRGGRLLVLYGGVAFILVGGAAAIVLNQPEPQRPRHIPPVVLTGRVVSLVRGVKGGRLLVVLRPSGGSARADAKTDHFGDFFFRSDYRGLADVFVPSEPSASWICQPVRNLSVPATKPVEIVLIEGTAVRGRLVRAGTPVANATVELFLVDRGRSSPLLDVVGAKNYTEDETNAAGAVGFSSRRISYCPARQAPTDGSGFFIFRNLPEDTEFWVHAQVGSLPDQGAFAPRKLRTGEDKTEVDLGDVEVRPGRRLAGRVIFADGKAPSSGLGAEVTQPYPASSFWSKLDEMGRFEFSGLHDGLVHVQIAFANLAAIARPGFRLSPRNKCLDPQAPWQLAGQLDRDITDLRILFEEGELPKPSQDPAVLAAFEKASAGPITGIAALSGRED